MSSEKLLIAFSVWCLSVKCHFVNGLYIQTSLAVNCLPATRHRYYQTYAQKWWSGKLKKEFFYFFFIFTSGRLCLTCGSRAAFPGGSRMIREGSHVWGKGRFLLWYLCFNFSNSFFAGFKLNSSTMAALVFKYSNVHNQVSLESFMCCLAKLMKLFSKYGNIQF